MTHDHKFFQFLFRRAGINGMFRDHSRLFQCFYVPMARGAAGHQKGRGGVRDHCVPSGPRFACKNKTDHSRIFFFVSRPSGPRPRAA
jgi:hypothetical protein